MTEDTCVVCGQSRHWCINPNCGDGKGQSETGHYGTTPAKYCDECRYVNIMSFGIAGDEPPNIATDLLAKGPRQ